MKKNLTEPVFIPGRNNGSMQGLAIDTIGGFTAMLTTQKQAPGKVFCCTPIRSTSANVVRQYTSQEFC